MKSNITIVKKVVKHIDSDNYVTSKDIKEAFGLKGDITSISLSEGLSPLQEEQGESHNKDKWCIHTRELRKEDSV